MSEYDPQWEEEIIWLDPTARERPYLRESTYKFNTRMRPPRKELKRFLAYATLRPEARSEHYQFERRVWHLMPHDPYPSGCPTEAVDPASIVAGKPSRRGRRDDPEATL